MREEMTPPLRLFTKCTGITCLLVFDYFLFSTGNPSVTFSLLGGWFELTLIGIIVVPSIYGFAVLGDEKTRKFFIYHVALICLFALVMFRISAGARNFAEARMQDQIAAFAAKPASNAVVASDESRRLMAQIAAGEYAMRPEGFIPVFRRGDFLLCTKAGKRYRLIATMSWKGTPQISVRELSDGERSGRP